MNLDDIDMIGSHLISILKKKEEMQNCGFKVEQADKLEKMIIELNSDIVNI